MATFASCLSLEAGRRVSLNFYIPLVNIPGCGFDRRPSAISTCIHFVNPVYIWFDLLLVS